MVKNENNDYQQVPVEQMEKLPIENVKLNDFFQLGRYTFVLILLCFMLMINQLGNALFMMFAGAAPKVVGCGSHDLSHTSDQIEACAQLFEIQKFDNCTIELKAQFRSINVEWGYYCSSTKIVKSSITYQMVGLLIGALIFGQISDTYGRKPAILIAVAFANIFSVASTFTGALFWFTVLRFFVNVFNVGGIVVLPIFTLEMLPQKDRYWINNLAGGALVLITYSSIAYLAGDWKNLARILGVLAIPAYMLLLFISESPRFLIQKGRISDAKSVLRRIHRMDKREFDDFLVDHVLEKENKIFLEKQSQKTKYTFLHLFYTPDLTRYTLSIAISFFTASMMTYALMFNIENIAGSIYLNLIISGIVRYISGGFISLLEVKCPKVGRKTLHFAILTICAICLLTFVIVIVTGYQAQLSLLLRLAALIILSFIAQMYLINGICATELFPTCIRNLTYSFGQLSNRIGVLLSPMVFFLADYWKPLPYLAMFLIVVFDIVFFHLNVKETKNNPMSDHMPGPEESWSERRKNRPAAIPIPNLKSMKNGEKLISQENA